MKNNQTEIKRGGARAGAGRPAGAPNRATAKRQSEIAASGLTPLDFMLAILRDPTKEDAARFEAAKAAAPYVHPRLASTEVKNPDGESFKHEFTWAG